MKYRELDTKDLWEIYYFKRPFRLEQKDLNATNLYNLALRCRPISILSHCDMHL